MMLYVIYLFITLSMSYSLKFNINLLKYNVLNKLSNNPMILKLSDKTSNTVDVLNKAVDLSSYSLWCKFDGFGVVNMTCGIELQPGNKAKFSNGIESFSPGFWRTIKYTDGREFVEITHPILPEYMFFYDISEPSILWRGFIDFKAKTITEGEVVTNKKRFGLIPYTEILATFTADILLPNEKLPDVYIPNLNEQSFEPPDGFDSPLDMKLYPNIFSQEYIDWWFASEDALTEGSTPPPRQKPFFAPTPTTDPNQSETETGGKAFKRKLNK